MAAQEPAGPSMITIQTETSNTTRASQDQTSKTIRTHARPIQHCLSQQPTTITSPYDYSTPDILFLPSTPSPITFPPSPTTSLSRSPGTYPRQPRSSERSFFHTITNHSANLEAPRNIPSAIRDHVRRDRTHRACLHPYVRCHCRQGRSNKTIGPFTTEVSQSLKIRNSNRTPVAFKVCYVVCAPTCIPVC